MVDTNNSRSDGPQLNRRRTLQALGAGVGAVVGLGTFAGSAAAWEDNYVDFKGCSSVWMIVSESDINYKPPTVADVIVETNDGGLDCRDVKFTEETTTTIPGQHGDAPVLKYSASSDEKILGVIMYNYSSEHGGINPDTEDGHPLRVNPNRCAHTPGTPNPMDADCGYRIFDKESDIIESRGASGDKGHGNDGHNGNGHGNGGGNGNGR